MDKPSLDFYDENAALLADRYEQVESPFTAIFPLVFSKGSRVLDIGCGSGRDLALLLECGYDAYGLDAAAALSARAVEYHPELRGRIYRGSLPHDIPDTLLGTFGGVLLSAVLMHIPDIELPNTATKLKLLLKPGGTLLLSVPDTRDDLVGESDRDGKGRLMIVRPIDKIQLLFERVGFEAAGTWRSADKFNRKGIGWVSMQFVRGFGS